MTNRHMAIVRVFSDPTQKPEFLTKYQGNKTFWSTHRCEAQKFLPYRVTTVLKKIQGIVPDPQNIKVG